MKSTAVILLVFFAATSPLRADQKQFLSHEDYAEKFTAAQRHLEEEEYFEARQEFEALSKIGLFEVPNYEPYFYIAKSHFMLGEVKSAQDHLNEFKCMLRVDSGVKKCSNATDYRNSTPDKIVTYESDFTNLQLCYKTMCHGIYFSYYDEPTTASLQEIAKYWSDVDDLQSRISQTANLKADQ